MVLQRLTFDALSAFALAVTALMGAYLPVFLSRRDKLQGGTGRSLVYVLGNMFSAGVMVSAGFCHLLGEALKLAPVPVGKGFPTAPFLCGLGYMLTLIADKIASAASGHHGHCHDSGHAGELLPGRGGIKDSIEFEALLHGGSSLSHASPTPGAPRAGSGDDAPSPRSNGGHLPHNRLQRHHSQPLQPFPKERHIGAADSISDLEGAVLGGGSGSGTAFELTTDGGPLASPAVAAAGVVGRSVSFITAMLMGVALCFHSLLEGAAMGAQQTVANSIHIFIAIVSHKGLAAYALGSSIVDADVSMRRFWSVVLPFTFASPVGIFLGYLISGLDKGAGAAAISALASGTFLYVAFMEVIPKELRDPANLILKMALLLLGFGMMSMLAIWA